MADNTMIAESGSLSAVHARARELSSDDHTYFDHSYLQMNNRRTALQSSLHSTLHLTFALVLLCGLSMLAMFGSTTKVMEESLATTRQLRKSEQESALPVASTEWAVRDAVEEPSDNADVVPANATATANAGNAMLDLFLEIQHRVAGMVTTDEDQNEIMEGKDGEGSSVGVIFDEASNATIALADAESAPAEEAAGEDETETETEIQAQ